MNAGPDYNRAKRQAQANANYTGVAWRIFLYNGVYWVERHIGQMQDVEIIQPERIMSCLK